MKAKKDNNNISVVQLSNYVSPEVREHSSLDWVTYDLVVDGKRGAKNSYFQYLIDRSRGSATNGAVINSVIDMIYGEGLTALDASRKPDEYASLKTIFGDEDIKRVINDVKRMGQGAFQLQYSKGRKIIKAVHMPVQTLAAGKVNEDGEIDTYYYASDWSKVRSKEQVTPISAFGMGGAKEILYIKPYNSGLFYYSTVDYVGGLQYAELEEEIGNYHINNIQNGLAPSMFINFNNGHPGDEKARQIEAKIQAKFGGSSNAGRAIISYNDNKELEGTITAVPLSDAPEQYQFLSDESVRKILVSHRVTSPLLLGISTTTGFGSNADELKTASLLFESLVIKPFRDLIIRSIDDVLGVNNISLKLAFTSLNPFDTGEAKKVEDLKLSEDREEACVHDEEEVDGGVAELLIGLGEDVSDDWELYDESPVDYEREDKLDALLSLANTGTARPNAKSEQDGEGRNDVKFYVRYKYAGNKFPQREFCRKMMAAGKIYRKEDIIQMGNKSVNAGHGVAGANTYSIWKYKGGVNCYHQWFRQIYYNKEDGEKVTEADRIGRQKAGVKGFKPEVNEAEVATPPSSMKDGGHHPSYTK